MSADPHRRAAVHADRYSVRPTRRGLCGKTINTLRLWAAVAPVSFDFQAFSHGQFVSALAGHWPPSPSPGFSTRRTPRRGGRRCGSAGVLSRRLLDGRSDPRFRRTNTDWNALPEKVASSSTIRIRRSRSPS